MSIVARKLVTAAAMFFLATAFIYFLVALLPGNAALVALGIHAEGPVLDTLIKELSLDQPLYIRYFDWLGAVFAGDFGTSYVYGIEVSRLLGERAQLSVPLALLAVVLLLLLSFTSGFVSAYGRGRRVVNIFDAALQLLLSLPGFWLGLMLILVFSYYLELVPAGGFPGWQDDSWGAFKALILPSFALAIPQAALLARVLSRCLGEAMDQDYFLSARASGLGKFAALWHHGLKNALLPVIAISALQFSYLVAAVVVIEKLFNLPGIGTLMVDAVNNRDVPIIAGAAFFIVSEVMIVAMLCELLALVVDPRLRLSKS